MTVKERQIDLAGNEILLQSNGSISVFTADQKLAASLIVCGPSSTGGDDTAILQSWIDLAASKYIPGGPRVEAVLPNNQIYYINGLIVRSNVNHRFGNNIFYKLYDGSSGGFNNTENATQSMLGTVMTLADKIRATVSADSSYTGSWYGSANNLGIYGGIWNGNGKALGRAGIYLVNVQDFDLDNLTYVHNLPYGAFYGITIGGKRGNIGPGVKVLNGKNTGQDGLHVIFGTDIHGVGGYFEGGDDALAFELDGKPDYSAFPDGLLFDDQSIGPNITWLAPTCISTKAHAVRIAISTYRFPGTVNLHKPVGITVINVGGRAGQTRSGGIKIDDISVTQSPGTICNNITNCYISTNNLQVGGVNHDGNNPYGFTIQNATKCKIEGSLTFIEPVGYASGYQFVLLNTAFPTFANTNLVSSTNYNFTIAVDGGAPVNITIPGSIAQNFTNLLNQINAALISNGVQATVDWAATNGVNALLFKSNSRASNSAIALTAGTLFTSALRAFASIPAAVAATSFNMIGGQVFNAQDSTVNLEMQVPLGGGITVTPYFNYFGTQQHRDIKIAGRLSGQPGLALPHLTVIHTPGIEITADFTEIQQNGAAQAIKFFPGSLVGVGINSCTPGSVGGTAGFGTVNTGTFIITGDYTGLLPINSRFAIAGNSDPRTNRIYSVYSTSFSGGNTTITVQEPIPLNGGTAAVLGFLVAGTFARIRGSKFSRAKGYFGTNRNTYAIYNGVAKRYANLMVSDCDFTEIDNPILTSDFSNEIQYEFNNCIGIRTKLSGTTTITSAATSATISLANLLDIYLAGNPPTQQQLNQQVRVRPTGSISSSTKWWITPGSDNTTFNINVDVAPGSTITFAYDVDTSKRVN